MTDMMAIIPLGFAAIVSAAVDATIDTRRGTSTSRT